MALLHYGLSKLGHQWVLSCECVPIDRFDSRVAAMSGAKSFMEAAKRRGDSATLTEGQNHANAAAT